MNVLPHEISPAELQQLREADAEQESPFLLVDCREQEEYDLVHIDGARLLPMSELVERRQELAGLEDRRIVVYCHMGVRSYNVVAWLREQGFQQTQSLQGGIDAWAVEIEPVMKRY